MDPMPRQRFVSIWLGFSVLYLALAAVGPKGLRSNGVWPFINQHLLQVRAWRGEDIVIPAEPGSIREIEVVSPGLAVTPYFKHWVVDDPRERVLLSNIALGVRPAGPERRLQPVQYLPADSLSAGLQLEGIQCHVGFPLGPAFLMYPLRFILGSALATQWLGALLGGLAVALMDRLLSWWLEAIRGEGVLKGGERVRLLGLAGMGTLWIWLVPQGEVWFFAQTVATCGFTLSMVLAWRRRWLSAGLAYALAITSRPTLLLGLPILLAILAYQSGPGDRLGGPDRTSRVRALLAAVVFPALLGGLHMLLNFFRFGSPLEFGYSYLLTPPELRQAFETYGQLSLHFVPTNLRYLFYQPPVPVVSDSGTWSFPILASDPWGMGLIFVTPAFIGVLLSVGGRWRGRGLVAACWLSLVLITLPALFYFNTGWVQWGGRYLLDAWPLWLLLTALGLGRLDRRAAALLVAASVVSNVVAAVAMAGGFWP